MAGKSSVARAQGGQQTIPLKAITITWPGDENDGLGQREMKITGEQLAMILEYLALRTPAGKWDYITNPDEWHYHLGGLSQISGALATAPDVADPAAGQHTVAWILEDVGHRLHAHLLGGRHLAERATVKVEAA